MLPREVLLTGPQAIEAFQRGIIDPADKTVRVIVYDNGAANMVADWLESQGLSSAGYRDS